MGSPSCATVNNFKLVMFEKTPNNYHIIIYGGKLNIFMCQMVPKKITPHSPEQAAGAHNRR